MEKTVANTHEARLEFLGVKRILVAVSPDKFNLTKDYFKPYRNIDIDYTTSSRIATSLIRQSYGRGKSYDVVVTSIAIEENSKGFDVVEEAGAHFAYPKIIFGVLDVNTSRSIERAMDLMINELEISDAIRRFQLQRERRGEPDSDLGKGWANTLRALQRMN